MLEQGNSSLSQSVTVYPALPRQPAGDLLATVRRITRDDEGGDGDNQFFFVFFCVCTKGLHIGCNLVKSK